MANDRRRVDELLRQDLAELKLTQIAENYREILDEAARQNTSMLDVLASLIATEVTARRERALQRRMQRARLPKRKTLEEYNFDFLKRIPKQKVLRLFDCEFIAQHRCAVLIGPTGVGKSHLLTALGYTACEKGIAVRSTRVIDMINTLTAAQVNGTLEKVLKSYVHPSLLLLDELGYLPIDKRGADLMFQVVAARYESGSIVITTNRPFRDWGKNFDVDNTLATAMIDRLMHHGEALVIQGESYRTKDNDQEVPRPPDIGANDADLGCWNRRDLLGSPVALRNQTLSEAAGAAISRPTPRRSPCPMFCGKFPSVGTFQLH